MRSCRFGAASTVTVVFWEDPAQLLEKKKTRLHQIHACGRLLPTSPTDLLSCGFHVDVKGLVSVSKNSIQEPGAEPHAL